MKRCPACDKTFDDGMKFCQTDGTLLVSDAPPADPYKTVVGNQSDIAAIPPLDPFKTVVGIPPKREDDVLQLPQEPDAMKTMVVSQDELREELKLSDTDDMLSLNSPPAPIGAAAPVPIIEPKVGMPGDLPPAPPKPQETSLNDATAVMDIKPPSGNLPSPFDSKPFQNDFSTQSPYGNQENKPIPSPFQDSLPPGYQPPSSSQFDAPKPPMVKEVEPPYSSSYQEPASPSPFQPPSPFGQAESFNPPMQQTEWTPPPAPMSEWQNQDLGSNTPFQPPVAGGQDQTLAIVSLVSGIVGILCCQIAAPVAIITGYMAKKKADENPEQFGGSGLALAGMITGGIGMLLLVLVIIYYIIVIAAVAVS
jgi:hypothetical protein